MTLSDVTSSPLIRFKPALHETNCHSFLCLPKRSVEITHTKLVEYEEKTDVATVSDPTENIGRGKCKKMNYEMVDAKWMLTL